MTFFVMWLIRRLISIVMRVEVDIRGYNFTKYMEEIKLPRFICLFFWYFCSVGRTEFQAKRYLCVSEINWNRIFHAERVISNLVGAVIPNCGFLLSISLFHGRSTGYGVFVQIRVCCTILHGFANWEIVLSQYRVLLLYLCGLYFSSFRRL